MTSNGLSFSASSDSILSVLQDLVHFYLVPIEAKLVAETGLYVYKTIDSFKKNNPNEVPLIKVGLLGKAPIDDFKLAQILFPDLDLVAALKVAKKCAAPELLSYIAFGLATQESANSRWVESALQYVSGKVRERHVILDEWSKHLDREIERQAPLVSVGKKFVSGRRRESLGPLAVAVSRRLRINPKETAAAMWTAFCLKPPKGLTFYENSIGKYVEYEVLVPKHQNDGAKPSVWLGLGNKSSADKTLKLKTAKYSRFKNIVSEQRKKVEIITV